MAYLFSPFDVHNHYLPYRCFGSPLLLWCSKISTYYTLKNIPIIVKVFFWWLSFLPFLCLATSWLKFFYSWQILKYLTFRQVCYDSKRVTAPQRCAVVPHSTLICPGENSEYPEIILGDCSAQQGVKQLKKMM